MYKKLCFNTSMPRSGSELLQVILSQNPKIYASTTSPLLEYQFAARNILNMPEVKSQNSKLMEKAFINMCGAMARSYYTPITDCSVVIDKNRGWCHYYEWVEQWNPNPKMFCIVRDLRSVLASMERIYRKNRHSPESIDVPLKLQNMTTIQRIDFWLGSPPIGIALNKTLDVFQRRINDKMYFIKYEELLQKPQETLNGLYEYLEEEPYKHDFDNIVKTVEEDHAHFGIFGNHDVRKKLGAYKPNDWSDIYNNDVSKSIFEKNKWYFDVFKYYV